MSHYELLNISFHQNAGLNVMNVQILVKYPYMKISIFTSIFLKSNNEYVFWLNNVTTYTIDKRSQNAVEIY